MLGELALQQKRLTGTDVLANRSEREQREAYEAELREQREKDAAAVEEAARESGHAMPPELLRSIRQDVYGIHDAE